jgi:site-specific DNA-methyltransferase (adenine-specific)
MGSGTTAIACLNTNRRFIGFELDLEYCRMAQERINRRRQELKSL